MSNNPQLWRAIEARFAIVNSGPPVLPSMVRGLLTSARTGRGAKNRRKNLSTFVVPVIAGFGWLRRSSFAEKLISFPTGAFPSVPNLFHLILVGPGLRA